MKHVIILCHCLNDARFSPKYALMFILRVFFGIGMLFTILYTTQELVLESIILLLTCEMSFLGLNKLVKKLDKIAQRSAKIGGFKAKCRVESRASTLLSSLNAPTTEL